MFFYFYFQCYITWEKSLTSQLEIGKKNLKYLIKNEINKCIMSPAYWIHVQEALEDPRKADTIGNSFQIRVISKKYYRQRSKKLCGKPKQSCEKV